MFTSNVQCVRFAAGVQQQGGHIEHFYSDIRIFFGGFTAAKIRRRIRLADFFSADIRLTKIRRLIQIFGGGLGVYAGRRTQAGDAMDQWRHQ